MSFYYSVFLWLLLPLGILYFYRPREFRDTIHMLLLALMIVTLARPVIKKHLEDTQIEGRDIIIALDLSYSMRATDIKESRYRYALKFIDLLLEKNAADSIALVGFTTNPLLLSPPTTDHPLIATALKALDIDAILTHGTSLQNLLKMIASLPMPHKNVVLITDGGEESNIDALSQIIKNTSMSLNIIAIGTPEGTPLLKEDGTMLKDSKGNLVVTRLNPLLAELAAVVDGGYFAADISPQELAQKVSSSIDNAVRQKNRATKKNLIATELYQFPLFFALILFLMLHTRAIKYLLIAATFLGIDAQAGWLDGYYLSRAYKYYEEQEYNQTFNTLKKIEDTSLEKQMILANSYYKIHEYNQALQIYNSIRSTSPKIKQALYYNIANSYAKIGKYNQARLYYGNALALGEDNDTLYNLQIIALLKDINLLQMSLSKPSPQQNSKTGEKQEGSDSSKGEENSQSGGGGGSQGDKNQKAKKETQEVMALTKQKKEAHPHSSKVYDLINKGYVNEKEPW